MKKYLFFTILFLILATEVFAISVETAHFENFLYKTTNECAYDNWISHISEGIASEGYNLYAPYDRQTNGFGNFLIAGADTLENWGEVVSTFLDGNFEAAQILIDSFEFPYEVVEFHDIETDRIYYLLRENVDMQYYDDNGTAYTGDDEHGAFDYGWGLYIYNPASEIPIIITAPHPNDDFITSAVSYKCFREWDARFLLINGAGREVEWTEVGNYSNSKSRSDPSRNTAHPFTVAYKLFCENIREEFGRREFSAQIHSYDWNRHVGYANCQISAGYGKNCPGLPIRDLSDLHLDIVNSTDNPVIPADSIGSNATVFINDFYAVNYNEFEFIYHNAPLPFSVNSSIDLPGYSQNRQMLYTYGDWNKYDVFEPFMHLEMDELPNSYFESEENYKWFYACDPLLGHYNMQEIFNNSLEYYSNWVEGLTNILPEFIELDDGLNPPVPEGLSLSSKTFEQMIFHWEGISAYDFWTYEIYYDVEPIVDPQNCERINRTDEPFLACQYADSSLVEGLEMNQEYYFRMRTKDYSGNYSELSQQISGFTAPAEISDFYATGINEAVDLTWTADFQAGNMGFVVYRKPYGGNSFTEIVSWESDSTLAGSTASHLTYAYQDTSVENSRVYTYCIASENAQGEHFISANTADASPEEIFELSIRNSDGTICDTVRFGANDFATDDYDPRFDIEKSGFTPPEYVYAAFYEPYWQTEYMYLNQEIHGEYDPQTEYKSWRLFIRTNQLYDTLSISVSADFNAEDGNLYLKDHQNNQFVNLTYTPLSYIPDQIGYQPFTLLWGDVKPQIEIDYTENRIYQASSEIDFSWDVLYSGLAENISLSLCNDEDTVTVANLLPPNTTRYNWEIPAEVSIQDARLCVQVVTTNGETVEKLSGYKLGVVPASITLQNPAGWHTIASPWNSDAQLNVTDIFGNGSELYTSVDSHFVLQENFEYNNGYWLYNPAPYLYINDGSIRKNAIDIELEPGWNLIPNPHLCSYDANQLLFVMESGVYSIFYMLSQQYISNEFFVYDNYGYTKTSTVNPKESFYLFVNDTLSSAVSCRFNPYQESGFLPDFHVDWELDITFSQVDKDNLIVGTSLWASNEFDFNYDKPEPPPKPLENGVSVYIPKDISVDTTFCYRKLNQEILPSLNSNLTDSCSWQFIAKIEDMRATEVNLKFGQLPNGYSAKFMIDGNIWDDLIGGVYSFEFDPSQVGELLGMLTVFNNLNKISGDHLSQEITYLTFPNPFKTEINFQFSLPQEDKVEVSIYNIRGQKIKTLSSDSFEEGITGVIWDGRDKFGSPVSSGIYFVLFNSKNKNVVKKVLKLK